MHEPCSECANRRGFAYTKDCDIECSYASAVKCRDDRINELDKMLEKYEQQLEAAYHVIGQLVDKPNPFDESSDFSRTVALTVLKDISRDMHPSVNLFGDKTLVINRDKFEAIRAKYLDRKE